MNEAIILSIAIILGLALITTLILFNKYKQDVNANISSLNYVFLYFTGKEYTLKNMPNKPTESELGTLIAKLIFDQVHRLDNEKKIIGLTNLMLGQISQGNFDENVSLTCKYPLYNSLITEANHMTDNLQQIMKELDKAINFLNPAHENTKSDKTSLRDIIIEKIKTLTESSILFISKTAEEDILEGERTLDSNISAMGDVSHSISQISKNIKDIEQVAFQIEILALNASVEAASVGEHGRGFAVVANSLRELVLTTNIASKNITHLINEAHQKSNESLAITNTARVAFYKVIHKISHTKTFH